MNDALGVSPLPGLSQSVASPGACGPLVDRAVSQPPQAPARILIVEDDADIRLGYQILLTFHGYQTLFAEDFSSARRQLDALPDLVILDLGLPGLDGFDVMEEFDLYMQLAPVIVVSGRDPHANEERALSAGAMAYVQKPWNDDQLMALIARLLADNQPDEEGVEPEGPPA